jgi:type 1 glutamine amidotransferase
MVALLRESALQRGQELLESLGGRFGTRNDVRKSIKRVLIAIPLVSLAVVAALVATNWNLIQRVFLGGLKVYETDLPTLPADLRHPAILVFSKTNGYRHEEAIPAANALLDMIAKENGWGIFKTENGAAFSPEILAQFDAVVFSNTSGDVFTPDQRAAFRAFLEGGGGYLGIHAAGDNSHAAWNWYIDKVIGTTFIGHPLDPQFQKATVRIEDRTNPSTRDLRSEWHRTDEWYSFDKSPRKPGISILATLDERTYKPGSFFGTGLAMGSDHPIIWTRCVGKGRALYSALGHTAATYAEPDYRNHIAGALKWVLKRDGEGCAPNIEAAQ